MSGRALEAAQQWLLLSLALAALATIVLVAPQSYQLVRQVDGGGVGLLQKALILCYSMSVYFAFALPLTAIAAGLHAAWRRWRSGRRAPGAAALSRLPTRARWTALALGLSPLLVAAAGFVQETRGNALEMNRVASRTERDVNLVLIVIDTLRADHVGSYGYPKPTTPFLDSLADEGVRFARCHASASWTKPSVATILTSLYPSTHGATSFRRQLPQGITTLPELLREAGFATYAYVSNSNLKAIFQFDQGFDVFDDRGLRDTLYLAALRRLPLLSDGLKQVTGLQFNFRDRDDAVTANARILSWLERNRDENFFMYLHYMEPHAPYSAPERYRAMFPPGASEGAQARAGYDADIRFLDDQLAALVARFEEIGIAEKTLFMVTSDHGEAFGEHGDQGHDHTVYQEQLHVPLILRNGTAIPAGRVVESAVRTVDLAPTLLDYAGLDAPPGMEGRTLLPLAVGGEEQIARNVFIDHHSARARNRFRGLITGGRWKYIETLQSELRDPEQFGSEELYDLARDPEETINLLARRPERASALRRQCNEMARRTEAAALETDAVDRLDAATRRQLEALGYLD